MNARAPRRTLDMVRRPPMNPYEAPKAASDDQSIILGDKPTRAFGDLLDERFRHLFTPFSNNLRTADLEVVCTTSGQLRQR